MRYGALGNCLELQNTPLPPLHGPWLTANPGPDIKNCNGGRELNNFIPRSAGNLVIKLDGPRANSAVALKGIFISNEVCCYCIKQVPIGRFRFYWRSYFNPHPCVPFSGVFRPIKYYNLRPLC